VLNVKQYSFYSSDPDDDDDDDFNPFDIRYDLMPSFLIVSPLTNVHRTIISVVLVLAQPVPIVKGLLVFFCRDVPHGEKKCLFGFVRNS
jgi:hypothetical protein